MRFSQYLKNINTDVVKCNLDLPPLPSRVDFLQYSRSLATLKKTRTFLASEKEAESITDFFGPDTWKDKTVVELFPGPGVLTRAMIRGGAKGIIPLESAKIFRPMHEELEKASGVPIAYEDADHRPDSYVHTLVHDIPEKHHTKVTRPVHTWDETHPSMLLTSLSSSIGESYHLSHLLQETIYNRIGWFKYGRVPIIMLVAPEVMKGFINASLNGFLWRAVAEVETFLDLTPEAFLTKRTLQAIKFIPLKEPKIKAPFDVFRYIVNQCMIRKAQSVGSCISSLAPGSAAIRSNLKLDLTKQPRHMTLQEMDHIALAYTNWFKKRHGVAPSHAVF